MVRIGVSLRTQNADFRGCAVAMIRKSVCLPPAPAPSKALCSSGALAMPISTSDLLTIGMITLSPAVG